MIFIVLMHWVMVSLMSLFLANIIVVRDIMGVTSKSFIFGYDFFLFREEKTNSDPNMKLLMFAERTL